MERASGTCYLAQTDPRFRVVAPGSMVQGQPPHRQNSEGLYLFAVLFEKLVAERHEQLRLGAVVVEKFDHIARAAQRGEIVEAVERLQAVARDLDVARGSKARPADEENKACGPFLFARADGMFGPAFGGTP
eukprot:3938678-Rhodomonas_salina.1